jgi:hypothetical protein
MNGHPVESFRTAKRMMLRLNSAFTLTEKVKCDATDGIQSAKSKRTPETANPVAKCFNVNMSGCGIRSRT